MNANVANRFAPSDTDLEFDEIDTRNDLRNTMLDLKAGIDLEEKEIISGQQEFDSTDSVIADVFDQSNRRIFQPPDHLVRNAGRWRFFEDLLMTSLDRTVTTTNGERMAMTIRCDLDLYMAAIANHRLDEECSVAERRCRFRLSGSKSIGELARFLDHSDTAATTAGGRLEHDRKANTLGMRERVDFIHNFAAAPFRNRYTGLFREALGSDLVAEHSHGVSARTEKHDSFTRQPVDEDRIFSNETPARPDSIGAHLAQCREHGIMIEVGRDCAAFRGQ